MKKPIQSQLVGALSIIPPFDDLWESAAVAIPLFGGAKVPINFSHNDDEDFPAWLAEADKALLNFLGLTSADRDALTDLVHKEYTDFVEDVDYFFIAPGLAEMRTRSEIWNFIAPSEIQVAQRHRRDRDFYVSVSCNCGWDDEHGLQLVFRQGRKVTRIGGNDGHLTEADAWDKPDSEDALLSRF